MFYSLIGYRGCGKSTLAPVLAQKLNLDWVDADIELEERVGKTIADIFAQQGEPAFRAYEAETLKALYAGKPQVIATGGGAVLNAELRELMGNSGPVIWLQASLTTTLDRLLNDPTTGQRRPALTDQDPETEICTVYNSRVPLYEQTATVTIQTDQKTVEELVEEILTQLSQQPS